MFCRNCGKELADDAPFCPNCGAPQHQNQPRPNFVADPNRSSKDGLVTLLLCIFLGNLGIHSFYVGKTMNGVLQLVTFGGCGIWTLVDFIMILVGSYTDGEGKIIKLQTLSPETRLRLQRAWFFVLVSLPAWLYLIPTEGIFHGKTLCLYTRLFGVECWGCGMTRAVFSCLYLDFQGAWGYNRLIVVVMPLLIVYWAQLVLRAWRRAYPKQ